jgi:PadR family transcriptional regulator PadR
VYNKNTEGKKMSITHKNIQTKLTKGLLDLIILQLLDNHPMHGYEVIRTIRKSFGVTFGASTIYPLLGTMEKKKYINCQWQLNGERPKKVYALTTDGKCLLDYTAGSLRAICRTITTDNVHVYDSQLQFEVTENSNKKEYNSV